MERIVYKYQKKLKTGYTTGTCVAAAVQGCAYFLLSGKQRDKVTVVTPKNVPITLALNDLAKTPQGVSCYVEKESGDDPDVTNHIRIYACVNTGSDTLEKDTNQDSSHFKPSGKIVLGDGKYEIITGIGIGQVTKKGLQIPVGEPAINPIPRKMLENELDAVCDVYGYEGGLRVYLWIPQGEEVAKKTMNGLLGIQGGISILGTGGIVEPMSEQALLDTICTELKVRKAEGETRLVFVPGNYGAGYLKDYFQSDKIQPVVCSNFLGESLDMAISMDFAEVLIVGDFGKLVKLGAGIMNTHSKVADGRMEILGVHAAMAGANSSCVREVMACVTTEAALQRLEENGLMEEVLVSIMGQMDHHLKLRCGNQTKAGVAVFSASRGLIGETPLAQQLKHDIIKGKQKD